MKTIEWVQRHRFESLAAVFLIMIFTQLGLDISARLGDLTWVELLIGIFIFANILILILE
jgi:hypothetical protein